MIYLDLMPFEIQDMVYLEVHKKNFLSVKNELLIKTYDIKIKLEIQDMVDTIINNAIHTF